MVNLMKGKENKDRFTINYPVTPSRWMKQIHFHGVFKTQFLRRQVNPELLKVSEDRL